MASCIKGKDRSSPGQLKGGSVQVQTCCKQHMLAVQYGLSHGLLWLSGVNYKSNIHRVKITPASVCSPSTSLCLKQKPGAVVPLAASSTPREVAIMSSGKDVFFFFFRQLDAHNTGAFSK